MAMLQTPQSSTIGEHDEVLARSYFSTSGLKKHHKYDAWQASIAVLCDVAPTDRNSLALFDAQLESYMIGPIMASHCITRPQTFVRDARTIARDGMDHIMVQYYLCGGNVITTRNGIQKVVPGDIQIIDMGQDSENITFAGDPPSGYEQYAGHHINYTMFFARKRVEALLPHIELLHGRVLKAGTPFNRILKNHLQSLFDAAPFMTRKEAGSMVQPSVEILAASLSGLNDREEEGGYAINGAILMTVRKYIDQNLHNPDLGPHEIANVAGLSRASLFRLCKPYGGVMAMIRTRRLLRARHMLADSGTANSIKKIAYQLGFDYPSSFSRAFRQQFGFSPSDTKDQSMSVPAQHAGKSDQVELIGDRKYEYWMSNLVS